VAASSPAPEFQRASYGRLALIAGIVVIADQATKLAIMHTMQLYQSLPVIPGFFNLTYIHNPGGAFGFLAGQGLILRRVVFIGLSAGLAALVFWIYRETSRHQRWMASGLALIFGGALGNLVDRIRIGEVVDFLDFYLKGWHWPAFNVADSAITVGITIFVLQMLFAKTPARES